MKILSPNQSNQKATLIKLGSIVVSILLLAVYIWFYRSEPFEGPGYGYLDNWSLDILTFLPAVAAAFMATLTAVQFQPHDIPRRIWLSFAVGWWCWVAGEIAGMVYDYFYWETSYPDLTLIDLCWSAGYAFFGLALFYQFRLIYYYEDNQRAGNRLYLVLLLVALLLTFSLTLLARHFGLGEDIAWFPLYLGILYPVFDLVEGSAALWLFFLFGRGKWGRPWWGLIFFAIADSISIYFWIGGENNLAEETVNILSSFSDTIYVAGYLIVALAFLSIYLTLRSGAILHSKA